MTYILGARCKSGVVLVADKRITVGEGAERIYDNKLFSDVVDGVVIGFSGARRTFEYFRNEIIRSATAYKAKDPLHDIPIPELLSQISDIMYKVDLNYRGDSFDALVGISGTKYRSPSILKYFYQNGTHEPVVDYKAIGSGHPYGSIFLRQNSNPTMEQAAELGYLIIKYIETFELDLTVGLEEHHPQIWFIPDSTDAYEADEKVLENLKAKCRYKNRRNGKKQHMEAVVNPSCKIYPLQSLLYSPMVLFVTEHTLLPFLSLHWD
jgi:20S proteasome alpha/beta subunit